ncbi:double homeobox protein B [Erethizon dorsatum]
MDLNSASNEYLTKEASQDLMALTTQRRILGQAFEKNPFPDAVTREKLAEQVDTWESSILMWFQNQNSLCPEQSRRELLDLPADGTDERPDAPVQQRHDDLFVLPHEVPRFPPSSSFCSNQTFPPAPLPSHVSFELWDPFQVCVSQGPSVIGAEATQTMEGGERSDPPLTFMDRLLKLLTPGENYSDTQAPFRLHSDEGYTGPGALQGENHPQPHREHKEQPLPEGHIDLSYIMQWWDKGRQALITEWDPQEGTP